MFLPVTREEMHLLGWSDLDVVLVSGDAYIDSPYSGIALLGKLLVSRGYRVGVISQPDINSREDISRLGEPLLFWGVSAGAVDSMVANYTALNKRRRSDDFTPGGMNERRPDRACLVYTNLIRRYFKKTVPIFLGGIEASLRRIAHYDYWSDSIRRSILLDAKADGIMYGMAERTMLAAAEALRRGDDWRDVPGLCRIDSAPREDWIQLPSYETVSTDRNAFIDMFHTFYRNCEYPGGRGLCQRHGDRWLIHNPPSPLLEQSELDEVYGLDFEHDVHPSIRRQGKVKALDTVRFSITTHRGCYGGCNFCAITMHQGRRVVSRSERSILQEAESFVSKPHFNGVIRDVGGPTANMYGIDCIRMRTKGACEESDCISSHVCKVLRNDHGAQISLLRRIRAIEGVRKVFVASGIRYDMVVADTKNGEIYIRELVRHHVSGQLKLAPEHTDPDVLALMRKPVLETLGAFIRSYEKCNREEGRKQYLTYYFMVAHPGDNIIKIKRMRQYVKDKLHIVPEQVQVFTPLPSTYSALIYYTEMDPFTYEPLFVEKGLSGKRRMKEELCTLR